MQVLDPSEFDEISDYNLLIQSYMVSDPAAKSANVINQIGCWIDQLKVKDVMIITSEPYIASIDEKLCPSSRNCEVDNSCSFVEFAVTSEGPDGLGDGIYTTLATFNNIVPPTTFHLVLQNEVVNTELISRNSHIQELLKKVQIPKF